MSGECDWLEQMRIRENAESIAFYGGESNEKRILLEVRPKREGREFFNLRLWPSSVLGSNRDRYRDIEPVISIYLRVSQGTRSCGLRALSDFVKNIFVERLSLKGKIRMNIFNAIMQFVDSWG